MYCLPFGQVFFHGVGFVAGQSDTYNPEYLVQKGVIVGTCLSIYNMTLFIANMHFIHSTVAVTVQYRLGSMGFLSSGDKHQPGNQGMLDQVEALRWVKKNIINFKGDPEKVVIFGESAGAVAVTLHLLSPLTKGVLCYITVPTF